MTSRIAMAFAKAAQHRRAAYAPFLMAGFPNWETFSRLLKELDNLSCDIVEVGVPAPCAPLDGPAIQKAGNIALGNGATIETVLTTIESASPRVAAPIVLMTYYDVVSGMPMKEFCKRVKKAGMSGVIIPDVPENLAVEWKIAANALGIDTIFLVNPSMRSSEIESIARLSTGFVYFRTTTRQTGAKVIVAEELLSILAHVKRLSSIPVAAGFGIASSEQTRLLAQVADGVIVGSALVQKILDAHNENDAVNSVLGFSKEILAASRKCAKSSPLRMHCDASVGRE
ncbi:MAG: tryptophan synthase subunit alpha [Desulfomonilaceae bacterium]